MTSRPRGYDIALPATELSTLILVVHDVSTRRFVSEHGAVTDISPTWIADLSGAECIRRHAAIGSAPLSAVAVHRRRATVDVLFYLIGASANGRFIGAHEAPGDDLFEDETQFAGSLAEHAWSALVQSGVRAELHPASGGRVGD